MAAYDSIASRSGLPPLVADLARIRAALILVDSQSPQDLSSRIGDLAQTGNPWRHAAREILGLAAYRTNDLAARPQVFRRDRQTTRIGTGRPLAGAVDADADPVARRAPPPAEPEEG